MIRSTLLCSAALALCASAATAQNFGGWATLSFGQDVYNNADDPTDSDYDNATATVIGFSGSVGGSFGAFGMQLDANTESSGDTDEPGYAASTYTLHANYRMANYAFGIFGGKATNNENTDSDDGEVEFYGIEAAAEFGDFHVAGQFGQASHENSHSSLDYNNYGFAIVEGHYYLQNGMTVFGNIGYGGGQVHGDNMNLTQVEIGLTTPLGSTGVLGSASIRHANVSGDDGSINQTRFMLGLTIPFGGAIRDVRRDSTPMINSNLPATVAVFTEVTD